jgi:deleted-in-malignant-brain-tumors protein 1
VYNHFSESIDGGFSDWSVWTACSVTCGSGQQSRNRTCSNPEPQNGGNVCEGDFGETQPCSSDSCPPGKK